MLIVKILFFSVLFFFQVTWLLCIDIHKSEKCPIQPFKYPFATKVNIFEDLKKELIVELPKLIPDADIFNIFALIGLIITISEFVLIIKSLGKIPPLDIIYGAF